MKNNPEVHHVKFRENPYGGWYAVFYDASDKRLGDRYYLVMPRWWFKVVAKRALKNAMIFDGAEVSK